MKKILVLNLMVLIILVLTVPSYTAESEGEKLLDLLVEKGVVTREEASGLRADLAIKQQEDKALQKEFTISTGRLLKITGYTQPRYLQDNSSNNTFSTKRTRLDIKGDITERFDYRFQSDFVGTAAKLLDITIGFKFNPHLKATVGQFKIPFSQENLLSSPKLETVERSQVVEALVARGKDIIGNHNGRDIGVQIGGSSVSIKDYYLFEYAVGVFNGSGINTTDLDEQKDVVGRLVLRPSKDWSIGGSYYGGTYTLSSAPSLRGDRDRIGTEFAYVHESISLKGEYIKGRDGAVNKDGWYLQGGYFIVPKVFQGVFKLDTYDPNTKKTNNETNISTVGLNWYFNKWVVLQIDYLIKDELGKEINNNSLIGQLTLQF